MESIGSDFLLGSTQKHIVARCSHIVFGGLGWIKRDYKLGMPSLEPA